MTFYGFCVKWNGVLKSVFYAKKVVDTEILFEGAPSSRNSKANPFVVEFHRFAGYAMAAFVK